MKQKSLYISPKNKNVGSLFISISLMKFLKKNFSKVAFFKPVIYSKAKEDYNISFMLKKYNLDMSYEECYGFALEDVEAMIASGGEDEFLIGLIEKYKELEKKYDFILCEGLRRDSLNRDIPYDLNLKIAQNFSSPYVNVISAKDRNTNDIYEDVILEKKNISSCGCEHLATFVSRAGENFDELKNMLSTEDDVYLLREVAKLDMLSVEDIIEDMDVEIINKNQAYSDISGFRVADTLASDFVKEIKEGELLIVSSLRVDIVLELLKTSKKIAALLFTSSMNITPDMLKLLKSLKYTVLSTTADTFNAIKQLQKVYVKLRVLNHKKISLALELFNSSVDIGQLQTKLQNSSTCVMTPLMFEYKLFETAKRKKKRVLLPESLDERILRAAEAIIKKGVADIIFLGSSEEFMKKCSEIGVDLSLTTFIDHLNSPLIDEFANEFYKLRKHKGVTLETAKATMRDVNYFATMMVHLGYADGMVSGAIHSSADTLKPALQIIKTKDDVLIASSLFFMCLETKVLVFGDCALNQNPSPKELAQIAISCAKSASFFGIEPKVAMLSYSTLGSGSGDDVDLVIEALKIIKQREPNLLVDGPLQYDAAVDRDVAKIKTAGSKVAGEATVLIFPDLNTGNNTYKAVQRTAHTIAIGPILLGLKKPINDLSRGALVKDIINTIAITAIQAGENN